MATTCERVWRTVSTLMKDVSVCADFHYLWVGKKYLTVEMLFYFYIPAQLSDIRRNSVSMLPPALITSLEKSCSSRVPSAFEGSVAGWGRGDWTELTWGLPAWPGDELSFLLHRQHFALTQRAARFTFTLPEFNTQTPRSCAARRYMNLLE